MRKLYTVVGYMLLIDIYADMSVMILMKNFPGSVQSNLTIVYYDNRRICDACMNDMNVDFLLGYLIAFFIHSLFSQERLFFSHHDRTMVLLKCQQIV